MKTCQHCKEVKPISEFHKNRAQRDGLAGYCKPCKADSQSHRQRRYNLSGEKYEEILNSQNNSCAICGTTESGYKSGAGFAVDHDHSCCPGIYSCGECVRGLLCRSCNWGLGSFNDNLDKLSAAMDYLMVFSQRGEK